MKIFYCLYIALIVCLFHSSTAFTKDIIKDINAILQVEDEEEEQQNVAKRKQESQGRKRIVSRYSEDNLPRTRDFVDAFKIAVEVIFGETKEDTALDAVRNAAYMLKGTSLFITKGLDYCMEHKYLGNKGKEAKELFLEKNNIILTNVDLVFSKTKPVTEKEQEVLDTFAEKAIQRDFTSIDKCVKHEYQVKRGNYTLSTYDKTKGYVDIVNTFLRTE